MDAGLAGTGISKFTNIGSILEYNTDNGRARSAPTRSPHATLTSSKRMSRVSFNLKERRPGPHYGSPLYNGFTSALLPPSPEPTPRPNIYPGIVPRAQPAPVHVSEVQSRDDGSANIMHVTGRQNTMDSLDQISMPLDLLAPARLQLAIKCASSPASSGSYPLSEKPSAASAIASPTCHTSGPSLLTMFASAPLNKSEASISPVEKPCPPPATVTSTQTTPPLFLTETTAPDPLIISSSSSFIPYGSKRDPLPLPPQEPTFDSVRQLLSNLNLPHAPGLNLPLDSAPSPPPSYHPHLHNSTHQHEAPPSLGMQTRESQTLIPMLPMPAHLTQRNQHISIAPIAVEEARREKREGDGLSNWRRGQLLALSHLIEKGLPSDQSFSVLGIADDASASLHVIENWDGHEVKSLYLVPVSLLKLIAVRSLARARRESLSLGLQDLKNKLKEVKKELDLSSAYEAALKLGVPKSRLGKFRRLGVTGFTVSVLQQLYSKLRLKLFVSLLKQRLGLKKDLEALIEQSNLSMSSFFTRVVMQRWHQVAKERALGRSKSALYQHQQISKRAHKGLLMWHVVSKYRQQLRRLISHGIWTTEKKRTREAFLGWLDHTRRVKWREGILSGLVEERQRQQVQAWHQWASQRVTKARKEARSLSHRRRSLLAASLAHWRILQLRGRVRVLRHQALGTWYKMRLKGRVLKVWHFIARRATAIIAKANARGARQHAIHAPPPRSLSSGASAAAEVMSQAAVSVQTILDEILHLQRYCTLSLGLSLSKPDLSNKDEAQEDAEGELGASAGGGGRGRLLMGQWNKKQEVIHLVSHKLAIEEKLMEAEADLASQTNKHERLSFAMFTRLAMLREGCEGHKRHLESLVEESGSLEQEAGEIDRKIELFESIRIPETEAEVARTSSIAVSARSEASEAASFESSNGNEAVRASLFHRAAIERVQACTSALSAAEEEVPRASSAEQRAREKLLLEQRRLSEALSITSSLSQHLKESQLAKERAPAYQKPRHRQAVSEAEEALQEARKIQVLQQIEVDHQQAAVDALALAAELARARAKEADSDWKQASSDAQAALHAASAVALKVKSEGSTAYRMMQRAEAARQAAESAASAAGDARAELQRMRSRLTEVHRQLEVLGVSADKIPRSIKAADEEGRVIHDHVESSESELTSIRLRLQPVIFRCNVLLMQLGKELSVHPDHLVRVIEEEVRARREEQRRQLNESQAIHSLSRDGTQKESALLSSDLPASVSQLLTLPPPPPSAPRPSINPEEDPSDLRGALKLRAWARRQGLMPLHHFGGHPRGRPEEASPSRPLHEGRHDDSPLDVRMILPGDEPWVPPGPDPHHISMVRLRSPSPPRSRSRSPSRSSAVPSPPKPTPQLRPAPEPAPSINNTFSFPPPPSSSAEQAAAASGEPPMNLAELSLANSPDEPQPPSQPQPLPPPSQPLLWEWLGAGPPTLMMGGPSQYPRVPRWSGEGGRASSIASSSDFSAPLRNQQQRGDVKKGINSKVGSQRGAGAALIYPLKSLQQAQHKDKQRPPFRPSGPSARTADLKGRAPHYAAVVELPGYAAGGGGGEEELEMGWGDDESSESSLPQSVMRVVMMDRDRRVKRRVVKGLKVSVLNSRAKKAIADEQAGAYRLLRSFREWSKIARSTAAGSLKLKRLCVLHRNIQQWKAWTARRAFYRGLIEAAAGNRRERLRRLILRQWRKLVDSRLFHESIGRAGELRYLVRRSFRYWKGLVEARQLIVRVFLVAEESWERRVDSALVFGEQFQLLGNVLDKWRGRTLVKREKRQGRAKEESAAVHHRTRILVGVFRALQQEVESSWRERHMRSVCSKILNTWNERTRVKLAEGSSCLVAIRRRLRICHQRQCGFPVLNESGHYSGMLMRRCFWAWASSGLLGSTLYYEQQLQRRAWSAWRDCCSESKSRRRAAIELGERHLMRKTLRRWKGSCDEGVRLRRLERLAGIWRSRNLSHLVLIGFKRHVASRRVLMASLQAALLQRYSSLLRRCFRAWRVKGEVSVRQHDMSLMRRAWKAWKVLDTRSCMLRRIQGTGPGNDDAWTIKSFKPGPSSPSGAAAEHHLCPAALKLVAASKNMAQQVYRSISASSPSGITVISLSDL